MTVTSEAFLLPRIQYGSRSRLDDRITIGGVEYRDDEIRDISRISYTSWVPKGRGDPIDSVLMAPGDKLTFESSNITAFSTVFGGESSVRFFSSKSGFKICASLVAPASPPSPLSPPPPPLLGSITLNITTGMVIGGANGFNATASGFIDSSLYDPQMGKTSRAPSDSSWTSLIRVDGHRSPWNGIQVGGPRRHSSAPRSAPLSKWDPATTLIWM